MKISAVNIANKHQFAELLTEASAWQKAHGSEGSTYSFDDEWMKPRIERGELFLADLEGDPVAAFRILLEDRSYLNDREIGNSIYLNTFAVRRNMAGLGIGIHIIEELVAIGRNRGRSKIRLDCFLSSLRLISLYERNGFTSFGTKFMNNKMINLIERFI